MFSFLAALPLMFASQQTITANVCPQPLDTVISSPVDKTQTDKSTITMSGATYADSTIRISTNGSLVVMVRSDEAGSFSANVPLQPGKNVLSAKITDICDRTYDISGGSVVYTPKAPPPRTDPAPVQSPTTGTVAPSTTTSTRATPTSGTPTTEAPVQNEAKPEEELRIFVTSPSNGTTTQQSNIVVEGRTNLSAKITMTVNSRIVTSYAVAGETFSAQVPLEPGGNSIGIQATTTEQTEHASIFVERLNPDGSQFEAAPPTQWYQTGFGQILMVLAALVALIPLIYYHPHIFDKI